MRMSLFRKLWRMRWVLRSIFSTLYFNFHYLPFKQAIRLPILLYKPKLLKCKGCVKICKPGVKFGMIRLGTYRVSIYPNSGIIWENDGTIEFHGHCSIGKNSSLSIGANGVVTFGDMFSATTTLRLVCYNRISFEERVCIGWECSFMDTDFHRMKKLDGGYTKGFGSIQIGKGCWFANRCTILKNTQTAEYNTFSTGSIVSKKFNIPYAVYGPSNIELKREGIYIDIEDDKINYESF